MQRLGQARNTRLGIPRVQRPRHPQAPKLGAAKPAYTPRAGLASRVVAKGIPAPAATTPAQSSVPSTQTTPVDPLASGHHEKSPAPPAPPAPKGLFEAPGAVGFTPDPTYWANLAKIQFADQQKYSEGLREQQMADTGYNDALQTAIRNRATQQRGLGENAIRGNLGNSGWLDRNEAEDTTAYTQERGHAQLQKTEEDAGRAAARQAIVEGFTLEAASELAEAAGRDAARKQEAAERAEALAAEGGGGEEGGGGGPGWSGSAPTGPAAGPFWGAKGPGGYKQNPRKIAIGQRRRAR